MIEELQAKVAKARTEFDVASMEMDMMNAEEAKQAEADAF